MLTENWLNREVYVKVVSFVADEKNNIFFTTIQTKYQHKYFVFGYTRNSYIGSGFVFQRYTIPTRNSIRFVQFKARS